MLVNKLCLNIPQHIKVFLTSPVHDPRWGNVTNFHEEKVNITSTLVNAKKLTPTIIWKLRSCTYQYICFVYIHIPKYTPLDLWRNSLTLLSNSCGLYNLKLLDCLWSCFLILSFHYNVLIDSSRQFLEFFSHDLSWKQFTWPISRV